MEARMADAWSWLVADYDEALAGWNKTSAAASALGDKDCGSEQEREHLDAAAALDACEDRLLNASPPHLSAVALQLKLLAERFHFADLEGPPMAGEDAIPGGVLRRIYEAVRSAS
jgi:hypothetical protein